MILLAGGQEPQFKKNQKHQNSVLLILLKHKLKKRREIDPIPEIGIDEFI